MRRPRDSHRKVVLSSSDDDGGGNGSSQGASQTSRQQSQTPTKTRQSLITQLTSPKSEASKGKSLAERQRSIPQGSQPQSQFPSKNKSRTQAKGKLKANVKAKTLHSFFAAAASQSQSSEPLGSPTKSIKDADLIDLIQDDVIGNDSDISTSTREGRDDERRLKRLYQNINGHGDALLGGSQKFRRTSTVVRVKPEENEKNTPTVDDRPWTEKYAPINIGELAVHKKKVDEVRHWLRSVYGGSTSKSVLILRGPAGCGKSTTVSLLARELDIHLQEWKSSSSSSYGAEGFTSATAQFEDFVGRAGKYGYLKMDTDKASDGHSIAAQNAKSDKQAIFVEEFPLSSLQNSSAALQAFRTSILRFLAVNTPASAIVQGFSRSSTAATPMILSISESLLNCSSIADTFTAHRLFGAELLTHPGVTVIDFNPIAPTLLQKGLDVVIRKDVKNSKQLIRPGSHVLKRLAESGDIRSAVSSLEFMYVHGNASETELGMPSEFLACPSKHNSMLNDNGLEAVTQRESSLGLFHAIGKIVYNKRDAASYDYVPQPPSYFPEHVRPKVSEVDPESLIDELGTDVDTFVSALHENYILSCEAGSTEETLDSIIECIDGLSDTDILEKGDERSQSNGASFRGSSSQLMRHDEIVFHAAVRGILFSLPHPVRRKQPRASGGNARGNRINAFKMYYPTSLRLWRQKEEYSDMLDLLLNRAQRGELNAIETAHPLSEAGSGITQNLKRLYFRPKYDQWADNEVFSDEPRNKQQQNGPGKVHEEAAFNMGSLARYEMLLERVPYMRILGQAQRVKLAYFEDISFLSEFRGIGFQEGDLPDSDEDETKRPRVEKKKRSAGGRLGELNAKSKTDEQQATTSLVLSDDDIVDD